MLPVTMVAVALSLLAVLTSALDLALALDQTGLVGRAQVVALVRALALALALAAVQVLDLSPPTDLDLDLDLEQAQAQVPVTGLDLVVMMALALVQQLVQDLATVVELEVVPKAALCLCRPRQLLSTTPLQ